MTGINSLNYYNFPSWEQSPKANDYNQYDSAYIDSLQEETLEDSFSKSTTVYEQEKETQAFSTEEKANKIYTETYNEVMEDFVNTNPVLAEMNLPMPKLTIVDLQKQGADSATVGAYNFCNNEIKVDKELLSQDLYMTLVKNGDGPANIKVSNQDELQYLKENNPDIEAIKLTQDEKEFHVKSILAHELRHYMQYHLIASTQNCAEKQLAYHSEINQGLEEAITDYVDTCEENGIEPNCNVTNKIYTYWETYEPNTMLPEDTTIKFSSDPNDGRYWSVSKDFFDISNALIRQEDSDITYFGRPTEIDAYNYEAEYIDKNAEKNNVRPEVANYFLTCASTNRDNGLYYLNQYNLEAAK